MNLMEELTWRGLIKDVTSQEVIANLLKEKSPIYCGFDPTGPSLHLGHLVPILVLMRFQAEGHKIIPVVGGGTGLIGDPSGRNSERKLLTLETSLKNAEGIKSQLAKFLDFSDINKTEMVNNYDWLGKLNVIDYLRDFGKNFPINYMLAKDTVQSRLETGISYTEFSYMIIQSIDFYTLYKTKGCRLQLGGSDQWGNITSGVELIRKTTGDNDVAGIVMTLITKADGTKFGKSTGGSFFLDPNMTPPYSIYQYFLNTGDKDVIHYLKVFTFMDKETIDDYQKKTEEHPELREAQRALADTMIEFIHGKEVLKEVQMMSSALFGGEINKLSYAQLQVCLNGVPSASISEDMPLIDALVLVKAASSKREARELLSKGTYSINGEKISDLEYVLSRDKAIEKKLFVIRRGKKNYFMIEFK